jgi:hypothetical protein
MTKILAVAISTGLACTIAAPAHAQTPPTREQRDSRYQLGMMEGVLEKAVEHGADVMRQRLRAVLPGDMLLSEPARVRGIRLAGYGVLFDINVPSMQSAPLWTLQTLDQNNLGLESALNSLRAYVTASGDPNLQQALQRVEISTAPMPVLSAAQPVPGARVVSGSAASTVSNPVAPTSAAPTNDAIALSSNDPIVSNPTEASLREAYHAEITDALMEAMLDHSRGLGIAPSEWLVVVAGAANDQPLLTAEEQTFVLSIKGSDLADFLADRITHDEARRRIEVKVF